MTLIWHIVRKDARRLWIPLVAWAVLINAQHGMEWRLHEAALELPAWRTMLERQSILLFVLRLVVAYLLAAGLVFEDPAAGTTAFWMTRPISGGRMLGAKVVGGLVLLVALPIGVGLPWWWVGTNGFTPLQVGGWQTGIVLGGVTVAALTTSVPRFVAWTVVLQILSLLLVGVWLNPSAQSIAVIKSSLLAAPGTSVTAAVVFALAVGRAVLGRYQRRPLTFVWGALAVGAAAMLAISSMSLALMTPAGSSRQSTALNAACL